MAKNGKMVILRGTSDPHGKNKLPDEFGKPAKWPIGALHVRAAEDFARKRGYEPKTLGLEGQQSLYKGKQVREFLKLFAGLILGRKSYENDMELKPDLDIHALYGFSGGAYNVWWILNFLAENQPDDLQRVNLVVVLGLDKQYKRKADYEWAKYQAIAIKHGVHSGAWDKDKWKNGWETIYHTNPDRSLLPTTLPKEIRDKVSTQHMFGPDVLAAGNWPDET
jgi:hypothetical protein